MEKLLEIKNLNTTFQSRTGAVRAVYDTDLSIDKGSVVGLIGETGCGKSVLGLSVLRLLPNNAEISGSIMFEGEDLVSATEKEMRNIKGKRIAYIGQDPSEALNPVLKNGTQLNESVRRLMGGKLRDTGSISKDILTRLGFVHPDLIMKTYPVELSGGMKQRVLAAMAMCGKPAILIADEPTKGLDALMRGQITATLKKFITETGCAALVITHDLQFASLICSEIAVMYAGEIVEKGPAKEILENPAHPYLEALIRALPKNGMHILAGNSGSLTDINSGCRFAGRCIKAGTGCKNRHPLMIKIGRGHYVRCGKHD